MSASNTPSPAVRILDLFPGLGGISRATLLTDVVAGATLAAVAIPESMGYTKIAGMPVITGIYTLALPVIVFALIGSSRHLVVGADSASAAIMFAALTALGIKGLTPGSPEWVGLAGVIALLAALYLLVARLLRLGFLANFLSRTALVGFLTGVGIQVALTQLPAMLGIHASGSVISQVGTVIGHLGQTVAPTLLLATAAVVLIFAAGCRIRADPGRTPGGRRLDRSELGPAAGPSRRRGRRIGLAGVPAARACPSTSPGRRFSTWPVSPPRSSWSSWPRAPPPPAASPRSTARS